MYIEDILVGLTGYGVYSSWANIPLSRVHIKPVTSMALQVESNLPLTEKQAAYAIQILTKYRKRITATSGQDVMQFLNNPKYKLGIRKLMNKTISLSDDKQHIEIQFPYDAKLVDKLHSNRRFLSDPTSIKWTGKIWKLQLDESLLMHITDLFMDDGFIISDEIKTLIADINTIKENRHLYIQQLSHNNGEFVYKNAAKSVPPITSTDLLTVLFDAKKSGITDWDTSVSDMFHESGLDNITLQVLKNTEKMYTISTDNPIVCLTPIVKHHSRIMIIIPGGYELQSIVPCIDFLQKIGISNSAISVLFRLSNTTNKEFNQYVKDNKLNNPLSDTTKIAFVMGKLPKAVVEYDKEFDLVINLGMMSPHYVLKDYIKNHNCVINYNITSTMKESNFDNL